MAISLAAAIISAATLSAGATIFAASEARRSAKRQARVAEKQISAQREIAALANAPIEFNFPAPPPAPSIPTRSETAVQVERDRRQRIARIGGSTSGRGGTVLTGPTGVSALPAVQGKTLLGG